MSKQKLVEKVQRYVAGAQGAAERALVQVEQTLAREQSVEAEMGGWLHAMNKALANVKRSVESARTKVKDTVKGLTDEPIKAETKRIDDASVAAKDALATAVAETRKALDEAVAKVYAARDEALAEIQTACDEMTTAQSGMGACVEKAAQIVADVKNAAQACNAARGSIIDATSRLAALAPNEAAPAPVTE